MKMQNQLLIQIKRKIAKTFFYRKKKSSPELRLTQDQVLFLEKTRLFNASKRFSPTMTFRFSMSALAGESILTY